MAPASHELRIRASCKQGATSRSRHACHCGKGFIRKEHLRRHQLTHGRRSHACAICEKSFAREDVLRRHEGLHRSGFRQQRACDACHARKKKCDGDGDGKSRTPCSLCVARRISCTYSTVASGKPEDNPQVADDGLRTGESPPVNFTHPANCSLPTGPTGSTGRCHEAVHNLAMAGIQALLHAVTPSADRPAFETLRDVQVKAGVEDWFASCCQAFFANLHHRWPVVQISTFDVETEPLPLAATVVMFGCQLQGAGDDISEIAAHIHEILVQKLSNDMLSLKFARNDAWSFELYQSTFLNVVFALSWGTESALAKAFLLHTLFVTTLRGIGLFSQEAATYQENTHFPGTWGPYVMSIREKRKRLMTNIYVLDTYLATLRCQPPLLHVAELEAGLTTTFSLWNTSKIGIFYERLQSEPLNRSECSIYQLVAAEAPLLSSGFLIEDINIGLCSAWPEIWLYFQAWRSGVSTAISNKMSGSALLAKVSIWKARLDELSSIVHSHGSCAAKDLGSFLFQAYLGTEAPDQHGRADAALNRIKSLISDATLLHRLLTMILLNGPDHMTEEIANSSPGDMWTRLFTAARNHCNART